MNVCLLTACGLIFATPPNDEVLCERTTLVQKLPAREWATFRLLETTRSGEQRGIYGLSSVTVPPTGWEIQAVTILTTASSPGKWVKLRRARLNVLPKKGDIPSPDDDPRHGREVKVSVREFSKGVFAVVAPDLNLRLKPGDYWVGLTPICDFSTHGGAGHLLASAVRNARFDDVVRSPDGDGGAMPFLRNWAPLGPRIFSVPGEHLAIKIEGRRVARGRVVEWPTEAGPEVKRLHLRFAVFNPLAGQPKVPVELAARPTGRLWIVQSRSRVDQPFRAALSRAGATPLRYLPDDAYVVLLAPDAVETVRGLKIVRWVGQYHPAYRIDSGVLSEPIKDGAGGKLPRNEPEGMRRVRVYLFERGAAPKKSVAEAIRTAKGEVLFQSTRGSYIVANVPRDQVATLARRDEVCAIERDFEGFEPQQFGPGELYGGSKARVTMAQVRELCGAEVLKRAGYEGLGVRVGFWDDGIRTDHIDLLARGLITFVGPRARANANHGTAIAGILCGEGRGDPMARGLLPLGSLVFASSLASNAAADGYGIVEQFVSEHRAALMSNSSGGRFGVPAVTHYDGYAALLDDLVLQNDLLFCSAIGNDGPGKGHAGSWAKNVLQVGGVHPHGSIRREDHGPLAFTTGPAADGRVKPDLVHFGFGIYTASAAGPRVYENFAGTSCAAPLVAGHCGLMFEAWAGGAFGTRPLGRTVADRKPHAATAKALMINSAYCYPLGKGKGRLTRYQQGWGMPDLARLYESRKRLFVVDQESALHDHQAVEYRLRVAEGEPELRATLAYTDPLGMITSAKALVNDLDLIVIAPDGRRYFGNHGLLEGNASREAGTPDRVNNVESVFLDKPTPGIWRVVVVAHRIAWDERQGTATKGQAFGLVVSGVEPEPVRPKPLGK
jgi:hypothetical protein